MFKKVVALLCATVMIAIPTFAANSPTTIYNSINGTAKVSAATPKEDSLTVAVATELVEKITEGDSENSFYDAVKDTVDAYAALGEEITIEGDIEDLKGKTPIESEPFSHRVEEPGTMTFEADSFDKETEKPVIVVIDDEGKVIGIYNITFDEENNCWTVDIGLVGFFTIAV